MFSISPQVTLLVKYGFVGLVTIGAGFLMSHVAVFNYYQKPSKQVTDNLRYEPQVRSIHNVTSVLDKDFINCLSRQAKKFCMLSARSKTHNDSANALKKAHRHKKNSLGGVLYDFCAAAQSFGIKPVLIEPSVLYCMLSPFSKYALLTNEFTPSDVFGSKKHVTIAVSEEDASKLDQIASHDDGNGTFWKEDSCSFVKNNPVLDSVTDVLVHSLFTRGKFSVHVIVLEQREYLKTKSCHVPPFDNSKILFTNTDNAFENFMTIPLPSLDPVIANLYIPSDPLRFLLESTTSKLVKCNPVFSPSNSHPFLTMEQIELRTSIVVEELKSLLHGVFKNFWLWAASLKGLAENCDIFSRTHELNFAVPHIVLKSSNSSILERSKYLTLKKRYSINATDFKFVLDCHGLRVNIFAVFQDVSSIWYYERESNSSRIGFPKFKLCSADIFNKKVLRPCANIFQDFQE